VWKDARVLGKSAGEFANMIADGKAMSEIPGVGKFSGGKKGVEVNAVLIPPNPITTDNLNEVIDGGWVSKEKVCAGVAAGSVAACN
jgi:D-xylose transport system substrate-binding protein